MPEPQDFPVPTSPDQLLERGVWRLPFWSPTGGRVMTAIARDGREVARAEYHDEVAGAAIMAAFHDVLDAVDAQQ